MAASCAENGNWPSFPSCSAAMVTEIARTPAALAHVEVRGLAAALVVALAIAPSLGSVSVSSSIDVSLMPKVSG